MTTPATPPVARAHHVPEAVFGLAAIVTVMTANAVVVGIWWTKTNGDGSDALVFLAGGLGILMLMGAGAVMLRHRLARRVAIGTLAVAVVVDAIIVGYELSGATVLSGI